KAADAGTLDLTAVARGLKEGGLPAGDDVTAGLALEAAEHAEQLGTERKLKAKLRAPDRPLYPLAELDTTDIGRIYALAASLRAQGAAGHPSTSTRFSTIRTRR